MQKSPRDTLRKLNIAVTSVLRERLREGGMARNLRSGGIRPQGNLEQQRFVACEIFHNPLEAVASHRQSNPDPALLW